MTKFPSPTFRPEPYRPPTRAEIDGAREWYQQGFTVSRILARWDMSLGTLYYWLDGGPVVGAEDAPHPDPLPASGERESSELASGEREPHRLLPPIARRRVVVGRRRKPLKADRVSLTARLWRTAERQVHDIEDRLARPSSPTCRASPERERDVRMLAMLTRTLRDLSAFDVFAPTGAGAAKSTAKAGAPGPFDDEPPEDMDEFRNELARRIRNLVAAHEEREAAKRAAAETATDAKSTEARSDQSR